MSPRILVDRGRANRPIGTVVALHGFTRRPEHLGAPADSSVYLATHRPGISEVIDGSGHGDIEGEERWVYTRACGNRSAPQTRARVIAK